MLEVAESDFTRLLSESEASERSAQRAYDDLSQKNAVSKAAKQAEVKGKQGEVKSLELNMLNYKEVSAGLVSCQRLNLRHVPLIATSMDRTQ